MRHNNVHIVGIPAWVEGNCHIEFVEQSLLSTFGKDVFITLFLVEKMPRTQMRPLLPGIPTRLFLAKMLNFKDEELNLHSVWRGGKIV